MANIMTHGGRGAQRTVVSSGSGYEASCHSWFVVAAAPAPAPPAAGAADAIVYGETCVLGKGDCVVFGL